MKSDRHTPWSDVAELVRFEFTQDAQGFEELTPPAPIKRPIICDFTEGTGQKEFYYSQKEGLRASASIDLWTADYEGEEFVDFNGRRFKVIRSFVPAFGITTLILSEVIR